ncbi:MAG TPA: VOC family protein [Vicinamibacterales bacterium]|nr:VOC family protein [Vicinamibacterales bacterium]
MPRTHTEGATDEHGSTRKAATDEHGEGAFQTLAAEQQALPAANAAHLAPVSSMLGFVCQVRPAVRHLRNLRVGILISGRGSVFKTADVDTMAHGVRWRAEPSRTSKNETEEHRHHAAAAEKSHRWSTKVVSRTGIAMKPRVTSLAPQFLVDDLERSIAYYKKLGFTFGEPWDGFYAIGELNGLELHLKEAPHNQAERRWRRDCEHLDASAGVDGIEAFYEQCVANGVTIIKALAGTAWGTKDFYIEDPDGYIISFGGSPAAGPLESRRESS